MRLLADALALGEAERAELLAAARPAGRGAGDAVSEPILPAALPVPPTRLIGREAEVAALVALLAQRRCPVGDPDRTRRHRQDAAGAGGRRRSARSVSGRRLLRRSLAADRSDARRAHDRRHARRAGSRRPAARSRRSSDFLAAKRLLLLLDNCEQVLAAAPDVAALLATSPGVAILATSRAPLRIRGEREFPLLPLPLPAADRLPPT